MENVEKKFPKTSINWARHIYAKPSPNPYKIKKLEK